MSNRTNCKSVEAAFSSCRHVMQLYSDSWLTVRPKGKVVSPSKKSGKDRARQIEAGHTSPIIDGYRQFGLTVVPPVVQLQR
jgi:hypothetical protein